MSYTNKSKTYSTAVEGEISRINAFNYNDLKDIRKKYTRCFNDSKILKNFILKKVPEAEIKNVDKTIIAVDGSNYVEEYNSVVISLALAYVYTTKGYIERYLPEISIVPPYYSTLINSIIMKTLEYQIVIDLLNEKKFKDNNPDLILFDGPFSFPDEAISESVAEGKEIINKFYKKFSNTANKLFDMIKERHIPTIGLVKDTLSNKYLISLVNHSKINYELLNDQEIEKLIKNKEKTDKYIKKWGTNGEFSMISESVMIKYLFQPDNIFSRTIALPLSKGFGLRAEVPIINLKKGNLLGFYINILANYKVFFCEIPKYFQNQLEDILKIFSAICYYSLKPGYPMPLFAAHKKVELNKRNTKKKLSLIKYLVRIKDPKLYNIVFESKFHTEI